MRYKNTRTGAVIRTTGTVSGKEWELLDEVLSDTSEPDPVEDAPASDPIEDTPEVPEKPAPRRRVKK